MTCGIATAHEDPGPLTVECFEDAVPPFVEAALEQLYGNLFSSLAHRRVYGQARNLNTFVVRQGQRIQTLFLFERNLHSVRVLNEGFALSEEDAQRFSRHVFATWPSVGVVSFHAVQCAIEKLALPYRRYNCLEDMVLKLPDSTGDYLSMLGKSTRSYIQRYMNKLKRDFPSLRFELIEAHELDERHIRHIIDLNRARMAHKGKVSINDATLTEQITHLAMDCGMIGALTIEGRIVAGTINYRVRDNYFLEVIAHDPELNAYRLGTLCCYLTLIECIARGGDEYHFLWGQDEYKSRLGGRRRDLDDVAIYRSRMHMALNADITLLQMLNAYKRRARLRVRELRNGGGLRGKLLNLVGNFMRRTSTV